MGLKQWIEALKKLVEKLSDGNPQNVKMFHQSMSSRVITTEWKIIVRTICHDSHCSCQYCSRGL